MIELPESRVLADQLRQTLSGKTIASAQAAQSPHGFAAYTGDPADYNARLSGRTFTDAQGYGSYVDLDFEGLRLLLNDGAIIRYLTPEQKRPPKHQLLLEFEDGDALVCTIQMYAGIGLAEGESDNSYYNRARRAPSPLSKSFDRAHFDGIVNAAKPTLTAKGLLATEQRIPGLGNGCLQDILFQSGVHPQSKVGALERVDFDNIYATIKRLLANMTELGGRSTERDIFGKPGGYAVRLCAKTLPYPCPSCGGLLVRKAFLGGNIYFCGNCQPLKK